MSRDTHFHGAQKAIMQRSRQRTVKPIHNEVPESKYKIPLQSLGKAMGLPTPPKTDKVAYGAYIVNAVAHCFECHTTPDENGKKDFENHLGAGGFPLEKINDAFDLMRSGDEKALRSIVVL